MTKAERVQRATELLIEALTLLKAEKNACTVCGNVYNPKRSTSRYCGSACKTKAYRARKS